MFPSPALQSDAIK